METGPRCRRASPESCASAERARRSATGATTRGRSARSRGDWILSGDLFVRDADGYFWYQGRADDLLKVSGIWVAPLEIENCLLAHPDVAECAVIGVEEGGLTLACAYVVARRGRAISDDELRTFARERLAGHKVPREVLFVDSLPKTANDKVDRKALKALRAPWERDFAGERRVMDYVVGIDIGGTCTDCVVVDERGAT